MLQVCDVNMGRIIVEWLGMWHPQQQHGVPKTDVCHDLVNLPCQFAVKGKKLKITRSINSENACALDMHGQTSWFSHRTKKEMARRSGTHDQTEWQAKETSALSLIALKTLQRQNYELEFFHCRLDDFRWWARWSLWAVGCLTLT